MSFEIAIQFLFWATLVVLAIKFFLPDSEWSEVCIPVYGITLLFIGIFAIAPFVAIIGADWLGIILAIGIGYTIWCFIRTWDSWKK